MFEEDVITSCIAETASHIPYKVHMTGYFKCTGLACDEDDVPLEPAVDFAVKVVDGRQDGVYCVLGDEDVELPDDGASAFSLITGILLSGAIAMLA